SSVICAARSASSPRGPCACGARPASGRRSAMATAAADLGLERAEPGVLPPGPRAPALVQFLHFGFRPIAFLEECARRYGTPFTLRVPARPPLAMFSDPEAIREIFTGDPETLRAGEANNLLEPMLGQHSLLLLDGPRHLRQRRLMLPPFHGERMQAYGRVMREIADRSIDAWPVGRPFPIHERMQAITLDVILRTVFGLDEGALLDRLRERLRRLMAFVSGTLGVRPPVARPRGRGAAGRRLGGGGGGGVQRAGAPEPPRRPRRGRQGDGAPEPRDLPGEPPPPGADAHRRVRPARRRGRLALHLPDPPPPRPVAESGALRPGAVHRRPPESVRVLPLRRRGAPLHRRGVRHLRDEDRAGGDTDARRAERRARVHGPHRAPHRHPRALGRDAGGGGAPGARARLAGVAARAFVRPLAVRDHGGDRRDVLGPRKRVPAAGCLLRRGRGHARTDLLARFVLVYVPLLVLGAPARAIFWYTSFIGILGVIGHCNTRVRLPSAAHSLVMTPQFHALHHSIDRGLSDSNYANILPVWDTSSAPSATRTGTRRVRSACATT